MELRKEQWKPGGASKTGTGRRNRREKRRRKENLQVIEPIDDSRYLLERVAVIVSFEFQHDRRSQLKFWEIDDFLFIFVFGIEQIGWVAVINEGEISEEDANVGQSGRIFWNIVQYFSIIFVISLIIHDFLQLRQYFRV